MISCYVRTFKRNMARDGVTDHPLIVPLRIVTGKLVWGEGGDFHPRALLRDLIGRNFINLLRENVLYAHIVPQTRFDPLIEQYTQR